jgi:uncharacterized Ntn-hydrolase superfamily protein
MARAFRDSALLDLDERLLRVLEAGDAAGGDRRGRQSAALRWHDERAFPLLDLRVDEHADPVRELRRVHTVARAELLPFVLQMPHDLNGRGAVEPEVRRLLGMSPAERALERTNSPRS